MAEHRVARLVGASVLALFVSASGHVARGAEYTVSAAAVRIQGETKEVLTDADGMTLYYLATDTATRSTCTGGCAQIWPPLLSETAPTSKGSLRGKMALVKTANGSQVSYNGHLLYRYSGDTAARQANGQGVAGHWWVASIDLQPFAASGSNTTNGGGEGGGGNGGGTGSGGTGSGAGGGGTGSGGTSSGGTSSGGMGGGMGGGGMGSGGTRTGRSH